MTVMAVALTALLAAKGSTGWQRVERLTPGETIRVVRDSGAPVERRFAGRRGLAVGARARISAAAAIDRPRFEVVYRR